VELGRANDSDREPALEQGLLLRQLRRVVATLELVDADDRDDDDPLRSGGGAGSLNVAMKNSVAACWSGEGPVAVSMIVSAPASASSRPSPLTTSTPVEREIGTTSCPRCSKLSTRGDPTRPVAPVTAIFWPLSSACIVPPFEVPRAYAVSPLGRTGPVQIDTPLTRSGRVGGGCA
jgi:hypothetical protein